MSPQQEMGGRKSIQLLKLYLQKTTVEATKQKEGKKAG
jgi:hypothetical protein